MPLKDIRPAFSEFLLAGSAIAASVETRVYPIVLKQGVSGDSIVYQRISEVGDHHSQGASGLARVRMQVDSWSATRNGAAALGLVVKERLDGYRGTMGTGADEVMVQGVFFDSSRDDYDEESKMYRASQDYIITYEER